MACLFYQNDVSEKGTLGTQNRQFLLYIKIHVIVDALSNPIQIDLSDKQISEYTPARDLLTFFDQKHMRCA